MTALGSQDSPVFMASERINFNSQPIDVAFYSHSVINGLQSHSVLRNHSIHISSFTASLEFLTRESLAAASRQ